MKVRKAERSTRNTARGGAGRAAPARAEATSETRVTGLERDGEIRLTQLLRALASGPALRIKPAH
jgi:hypothetical protein